MNIYGICSSRTVVNGHVSAATILYDSSTGKIVDVVDKLIDADDVRNVSPAYLIPGLVDTHVHLNDPGREDWEGFETGTLAAVAGGVTTLVDMPLNSFPPTTTLSNLKMKIAATKGKLNCDVAFWGGLIPGNIKELPKLAKAGVRGFKAFLTDSGVDEFPSVKSTDVEAALEVLKRENTLLMFHAEQGTEIESDPGADPKDYRNFMDSRPDTMETNAIEALVNIWSSQSSTNDIPCHIVHLSSSASLPSIQQAQLNGLKITAETCFHYLCLNAQDIPRGATEFKCCPPIRDEANRKGLWAGIADGTITTVVSDHSPCIPALKLKTKLMPEGDFHKAWGGIASLGYGLPLLFKELKAKTSEDDAILQIVTLCCENTAKHAGLQHTKGSFQIGRDADWAVFDPSATWTVGSLEDNAQIPFKNKLSAYNGRQMHGRVISTGLRGSVVFDTTRSAILRSTGMRGRVIVDARTSNPL